MNLVDKINAKHKVDGFRQGKVPRSVFEKKFPGEIVMEAANELIDEKWYKSKTMLCENKFIVVVNNDDEIKQIKNAINRNKGQVNFVKLKQTHNVHSSAIRKGVKEGNYDILNNTKESVKLIIMDNKLYR